MKRTLTWLAALVATTLTVNAASAQDPYSVMAAGYAYPPGYGYGAYAPGAPGGPGETTSNYGGHGGGCADGKCGGGCAGGKCGGGGCSTCGGGAGKHPFLAYLACAGCPGCPKPALFHKNNCHKCAMCSALHGWLCRPCPSDAPTLRHSEYPLGFPNYPYVRSPRDYFMWNDP